MSWIIIGGIILGLLFALNASSPQAKTDEPKAVTLSEFGFPQIGEGHTKKVLMGTKWIDDPTIIGYGDYDTEAIYSEE
jgi:hypothetical protein